MGLLDEKVVLITGTGGGLGRVAAQTFAREGAKVVGCDIKVDANNETVELIGRAGGEMTGIAPIDLTDPDQAQKMIEDAVAAYCEGVVAALVDRDLLRQKAEVLGAMQRAKSEGDQERWDRLSRESVALETARRQLRKE